MRIRRWIAYLVLGLATFAGSGCADTLYELQPHRLWRLNRGTDPMRDGFYSVSDPIPSEALYPSKRDVAMQSSAP